MVFKGFTDGNGNVIPVQGAGTVYNEEKNSLALGKDTVANGQDQFVFGRANVEDATMVEIVGGGKYYIGKNITDTTWYGGDSYANLKSCIAMVTGVSYKNISILSMTELDNGIEYTEEEISSEIDEDELECFLFHLGNNRMTISAYWKGHGWVSSDYLHVNGYVNASGNFNSSTKITGMLLTNYPVVPSIAAVPQLDAINKSNIRTLDWRGNQWNAGDITCDDGNGNTISMRDLLSRIATLEAAQTNL